MILYPAPRITSRLAHAETTAPETVHLADLARKQSTAVSLQVMSLAETWLDFVGEEGVTARVEGGAVDSTRLSQRGAYSPSVGLFLTCPNSPV